MASSTTTSLGKSLMEQPQGELLIRPEAVTIGLKPWQMWVGISVLAAGAFSMGATYFSGNTWNARMEEKLESFSISVGERFKEAQKSLDRLVDRVDGQPSRREFDEVVRQLRETQTHVREIQAKLKE